ncbi:uncharacterized protein LOC108045831 [Drosophila rhopaloa]|uniref:Uncharacterized protein LOC108045831 n=1 Tax=Drosophila rhopaloa TaxID=1041015 RepID=A0A6P4EVJ0_DRORH|nr:uncharacterized protein LOC108045831 [Drosophila rhopaloa]
MGTPKNLIDLPFEVLDLIFKNLDEWDKWPLARVNNILGKAFAFHSRDNYERISVHYCSSLFIMSVLPLCGATVRHIEIDSSFEDFRILADLVVKFCDNLLSITMDVSSRPDDIRGTKWFLNTGIKLKSVEINVRIDSKTFPKIAGTLKTLPGFKGLHLNDIYMGVDPIIWSFLNLEALELHFGPIQRRYNIFELCSPLKNLRNLKIYSTEVHSSINIDEFIALEKFTIGQCIVSAPDLPFFKNLKAIGFVDNFTYVENMFFAWVLKHSKTLESLKFSYENIQNDDFFKIIKSCQNLRYIDLKMDIDNLLSKSFITKLLGILQENGVTPNNPFQLVTKKITHAAMKKIMPDTPNSKLLDFFTYEH